MKQIKCSLLVRSGLATVVAVGLIASVAVAAGSSVRVRVETANVREGPGTKYERLWTVGEDFPLEVVGRRGSWLKTRDFLDSEGWIFAPLTDAKAAAIVEVDEARVRSGPGLDHKVRFIAAWGESFRVLSHKGEWVKIDDPDNGRGWIHESLVWDP
ncbi:MAG: SH3 domain-containing protein [Candidatus Rokuibacteriota bacterium]